MCTAPPGYVFDTVTEADGSNPQGSVTFVVGDRFPISDPGHVTCLSVHGTRASVGVSFEGSPLIPPGSPHAALVFLEDNGTAGEDRFAVKDLHAVTAPKSCPARPPPGIAFENGNPYAPEDPGVQIVDEKPGPTMKRQCARGRWARFGFSGRKACIDFVEQMRIFTGAIREFQQPAFVGGITRGPDGDVWFTSDGIWRMSGSGRVTRISTLHTNAEAITAGPDGALWVAGGTGLTRVAADGTATPFAVTNLPTDPPQQSSPEVGDKAIAAGPDGALWFFETSYLYNPLGNRVARFGRMTTDGSFSPFPAPTTYAFNPPNAIVAGPDGALWSTLLNLDEIARISTDGAITRFPLPVRSGKAFPSGITVGSDGALWFTEQGDAKIGRITTDGRITEYPLPARVANPFPGIVPTGIAAGPDGALWFVENGADRIGRITTSGKFTEFPFRTLHGISLLNGATRGITPGPRHALYFVAGEHGQAIGRIASRPPSKRKCLHGGFVRYSFASRAACVAYVHQVPKN